MWLFDLFSLWLFKPRFHNVTFNLYIFTFCTYIMYFSILNVGLCEKSKTPKMSRKHYMHPNNWEFSISLNLRHNFCIYKINLVGGAFYERIMINFYSRFAVLSSFLHVYNAVICTFFIFFTSLVLLWEEPYHTWHVNEFVIPLFCICAAMSPRYVVGCLYSCVKFVVTKKKVWLFKLKYMLTLMGCFIL